MAPPTAAVRAVAAAARGQNDTSRTITSSNTAVVVAPGLWLDTGNPTYNTPLVPNRTVTDPTVVQCSPSVDHDDVKLSPVLLSRTHPGATPAAFGASWLLAFGAGRHWSDTPFPGVTTVITCREPGVRSSRIITPAFAHTCVFTRLRTRAVIVTSVDAHGMAT